MLRKPRFNLTFLCSEEKVCVQYKKLIGRSRGSAIVRSVMKGWEENLCSFWIMLKHLFDMFSYSFMSLVEGLPTYGVHYFEVKVSGGVLTPLKMKSRVIGFDTRKTI